MPSRSYRTDGRCPLCAGENPKENRSNCTKCWNEYHTSRSRYFKAISEAQEAHDLFMYHYNQKLAELNMPLDSLPPTFKRVWGRDADKLKDQLDYIRDRSWKEWLEGRKSGEIPQGQLYNQTVEYIEA